MALKVVLKDRYSLSAGNAVILGKAFIWEPSVLKIGKQYVAATQKACDKIEIVETYLLNEEDKESLLKESEKNRAEGISRAEEICKKYRREGRFFDEIINGGI